MLCSCPGNLQCYKMHVSYSSSLKYMIGLCVIGKTEVEISGCKQLHYATKQMTVLMKVKSEL
jgi:hypothetical protein